MTAPRREPLAKERPIIFTGPMVRAILAGRKTQTRRVVKPQPIQPEANCHPKHQARHSAPYLDAYCSQPKTEANPRGMGENWCWWQVDDRQCLPTFRCPYGQPGDRLWVRETWAEVTGPVPGDDAEAFYRERRGIAYRADFEPGQLPGIWTTPMYMKRRDSRLTLEVKAVRVERLNSISEADAKAEGAPESDAVQMRDGSPCYSAEFQKIWHSLHGIDSVTGWEANPWVWVIEFGTWCEPKAKDAKEGAG